MIDGLFWWIRRTFGSFLRRFIFSIFFLVLRVASYEIVLIGVEVSDHKKEINEYQIFEYCTWMEPVEIFIHITSAECTWILYVYPLYEYGGGRSKKSPKYINNNIIQPKWLITNNGKRISTLTFTTRLVQLVHPVSLAHQSTNHSFLMKMVCRIDRKDLLAWHFDSIKTLVYKRCVIKKKRYP